MKITEDRVEGQLRILEMLNLIDFAVASLVSKVLSSKPEQSVKHNMVYLSKLSDGWMELKIHSVHIKFPNTHQILLNLRNKGQL